MRPEQSDLVFFEAPSFKRSYAKHLRSIFVFIPGTFVDRRRDLVVVSAENGRNDNQKKDEYNRNAIWIKIIMFKIGIAGNYGEKYSFFGIFRGIGNK